MTMAAMTKDRIGALCTIGPAAAFMVGIVGIPLFYILYVSFNGPHFSPSAYVMLLSSRLFFQSLWSTFETSILATVLSVLLGYPVAVHLARQPARRRALMMIMVLMPFWTSVLVKSYAFTIILGRRGIINTALSCVVGHKVALPLLFNKFSVVIGMANYLVPFVVFPVLASLLAIDPALGRAATLMGARPMRVFRQITLPLSLPGVIAGASSTFIISLGFFVVPALLGGRHDVMLANLVDFYTRETLDWPAAAAIGMCLLAVIGMCGFIATTLRKVRRV
ncbi:ABC transporter permease [Komagataeibacter nataicola]|nr:ABC transporter permease [Komagataeibacter nataicola]WEQ57036.1 ABC transporter permease [Komagataeibacter nataicola]WNM08565.1 ABC transporter permease [Komagataeibacter nataicola]